MKSVDNLIKQIPIIQCPEGCTDCCGPVLLLRSEAIKLGFNERIGSTQAVGENYKCELCTESQGCQKYNDRPFTCRIFGAVVGGPNSCTKVLNPPEELLSVEEGAHLMAQYLKLVVKTRDEASVKTCMTFSKLHDKKEWKAGRLKSRSKRTIKNDKGEQAMVDDVIHYSIIDQYVRNKR